MWEWIFLGREMKKINWWWNDVHRSQEKKRPTDSINPKLFLGIGMKSEGFWENTSSRKEDFKPWILYFYDFHGKILIFLIYDSNWALNYAILEMKDFRNQFWKLRNLSKIIFPEIKRFWKTFCLIEFPNARIDFLDIFFRQKILGKKFIFRPLLRFFIQLK